MERRAWALQVFLETDNPGEVQPISSF